MKTLGRLFSALPPKNSAQVGPLLPMPVSAPYVLARAPDHLTEWFARTQATPEIQTKARSTFSAKAKAIVDAALLKHLDPASPQLTTLGLLNVELSPGVVEKVVARADLGDLHVKIAEQTVNEARLFQIATTSGNWDARRVAASKLRNPQLVHDAVREILPFSTKESFGVLNALIPQVTDSDLFAQIARRDSSGVPWNARYTFSEAQKAAVAQIRDQSILATIAQDEKAWAAIRRIAIDHLDPEAHQPILHAIAHSTDRNLHVAVRAAAAAKLMDAEAIKALARTEGYAFRSVLAELTHDQSLLHTLLIEKASRDGEDAKYFVKAAMKNLHDQALLLDIACRADLPYHHAEARTLATEKISDPNAIDRLAQDKTRHWDTRIAAIRRCENEDILFQIALREDGQFASPAADRVTRQANLKTLAVSAHWPWVRFAAAKNVEDVQFLRAQITSRSEYLQFGAILALSRHEPVPLANIRAFLDQNRLAKDYTQRLLPAISDQTLLRQLAMTHENYDVRSQAFKRLSDPQMLREIIESDTSLWHHRRDAVDRLPDAELPPQTTLERIARDPKSEGRLRASAVSRLDAAHPARVDLASDHYEEVREAAFEPITDQAMLMRIALESSRSDMRARAAKKVRGAENLERLAKDGQEEVASVAKAALFKASLKAALRAQDVLTLDRLVATHPEHLDVACTYVLDPLRAAFLSSDPTVSEALSATKEVARLKMIEFKDGGRQDADDFVRLHKKLRKRFLRIPPIEARADNAVADARRETPEVVQARYKELLRGPTKVDGRTLSSGNTSIKIMKASEASRSSNPLDDEWRMNGVMGELKTQLGLESEIPANSRRVRVAVPEAELKRIDKASRRFGSSEFKVAPAKNEGHDALAYNASPDYHDYLNNPTLRAHELTKSSAKCLRDLAKLSKVGLYNLSPTDFFHNTGDNRRYLWNAGDIFPNERNGAGRLDVWRNGLASVNFRKSGLADFKHYGTLAEVLERHPARALFERYKATQREQVMHATLVGDSLFGWALTVTDSWLSRLERREKGENVEVLDLRAQLEAGFVAFVAEYTGRSESDARELLRDAVDWDRLTAQLEYFCGRSYVSDVASGTFKARAQELYGRADVKVDEMTQGRGWDPKLGWVYDGKYPDLGPVNGPFPAQDLIALLYRVTALPMDPKNSILSRM